MSKIFSIIILSLLTNFIYSQIDTITIYIDANEKEVTKDKAEFVSKRFNENGKWMAHHYYTSGELQMIGTYKTNEYKTKEGYFTFFHKNGRKQSEGLYINNKKNGDWTFWEETGEIYKKGEYINGQLNGTVFWYNKGSLCSKEYYQNGEMKKFTFFDENGNKLPKNTQYEQQPQFPGGVKNLMLYIKKSINYPEDAIKNNSQGRVFVSITITKEGEIINPRVLNKIDKSLGDEAIRIIKNMPKWKPGKQHNRPVDVKYTIPILFKLSNYTK